MKKHTLLQRLLPLAMLGAMLLTAVPAAAAFHDTAGHWAEKTLNEWQDKGLIDGYGDGSFQPNGTVTRAEFIKLVNRTLGFTAESEISFSDVTERDWFHAEVAKAVTAGYAQGSGGLFRPNQPVTRAEAAVPDVAVDHGTSEADAMRRFPASVTLNVTENGTAGTVEAAVRWALDRAYSEDPRMDTVYTATGTVTIPDGYTYDGTLTVTASLTVTADPENVVVGILEVAGLELPYGAQESDVQLPAQVTVKIKNGHTERADVRWTLDGEWTSPGVNTFMGTVSMPPFQYYNGEMNADIKTTVTVLESGATPKTKAVVDYVPLALTSIGYMRAETLVLEAARQRLPADVLLRCEDDSYIEVVVRPDDLEFTKLPYAPTPGENQTVSFTGNAALPAGYAYAGGTSPVHCHLEVKALDTAALNGALAAAKTQLDTLTDSEDAALADNAKILVAADGTTPDRVPKGVKFIERSQTATLKDAYAAAQSKQNSGNFTSQTECDQTAQELQEASDALAAIVPNVGTLYTNAMILEAVKNGGAVNPQYSSEFAYSAEMQPLRNGYTYSLYGSSWTVPDSDVTVSIDWSFRGDGAQYLALAPDGGYDHNTYMHGYGVTVTRQPDEPTEVRFVATVKDFYGNVIGTLGENGEYAAIIGAPMRLSDDQPSAPRFASGANATGEIYLNLEGAAAITAVDASKISIVGRQGDAAYPNIFQITGPRITGGAKSLNGVCLNASLSTAQLAQSVRPTGSGADPTHAVGKVTVTIPKEALTLDGSKGWYLDADLTREVDIWLCNPQLSVNTQADTGGDTTRRNISVTAKYVGSAPVQVAYTKTNAEPDSSHPENVWVWVTLSSDQAATGPDGTKTYSVNSVEGFGNDGDYYVWCRAWEGAAGMWLYTYSFKVGGQETG